LEREQHAQLPVVLVEVLLPGSLGPLEVALLAFDAIVTAAFLVAIGGVGGHGP
jgi:hypothetical protein